MKILSRCAALLLVLCLILPMCALAETVYKQGNSGEKVYEIKQRMFELGYYNTKPANKQFNEIMTERVKLLQKQNGLKQTGVIDESLYALLYSKDVIAADGKAAATDGSAAEASLFKEGSSSASVKALKTRMRELLYFDPDQSVSNNFNETTTERIKLLQKTNNLPQTGIVTQSLYDFIMSDACLPCGSWYDYEMTIEAGYRYALSGEKLYHLSQSGNVVVFIVDYFANAYMANALKAYPHMLDSFTDFTYYNNCDPRYIGTFPSVCHMLTGVEFDTSLMIGEWFKKAWTSETANYIYDAIHAKGYEFNYYYYLSISSGMKADTLGKVDNLVDTAQPGHAPVLPIYSHTDFYDHLLSEGLTVDQTDTKYIQMIHLRGAHAPYTSDANAKEKEGGSRNENIAGYMKMVSAYIEMMKQNGTYDDATIIVTADHGDKDDNMQVVYFIKEPGVKRDKMATSAAPISHCDFPGTLLEAVGADYSQYGQSIHDFKDGDKRERSCGVVGRDVNSFPLVSCYSDPGLGAHNYFKTFTYTGDYDDMLKQIKRRKFTIEMLSQSFN